MKKLISVIFSLFILTMGCAKQGLGDLDNFAEVSEDARSLSGFDLERAYFLGGYFSAGAYDTRTDTITKKADGKPDAGAIALIDSLKRHGWRIQNFEAKGKVGKDIFQLDSQYLLAKKTEQNKNIYVVAFRGTQGILRDWVGSDFDLLPVKFLSSGTYVHRGFLQYTMPAYENAVLKNMIAAVKKDPKAVLIITGHSLGGAAALIYSAMLVESGMPKSKINLITFGQPAVGQPSFENKYKNSFNTYTRFVRVGDAVVVAAAAGNYRHFGTKIQDYGSINPVKAHDKFLYKDMAKKYSKNYSSYYGKD